MEAKMMKDKVITVPNVLSLFRVCLIPLIAWSYLCTENTLWAGNLLILSGLTDIADGFIARKYHMISDLGKILDPVADKLTQATMLVCLLLQYPLMRLPFLLLIIKEVFMGITGWLVIRKTGNVYGANWHGKAATIMLYAMMILHVFWQDIPSSFSCFTIVVSSGMILLSFVLYGIRNIRVLKGIM